VEAVDARKARVLSAVIDDYIRSAEPVGSRTLARRHAFGLSPATLRNELADLEDLGYLDKPHTSAGRVPSDKGYRYYVDRLLVRPQLAPLELERIRQAYRARVQEIQWFLHQTARLVAETTRYPAVVMAPPLSQVRLARLSFVPLGPRSAVMVVETDGGLVEHRVVAVPEGLSSGQLVAVAREVSRELQGLPLTEIAGTRLPQLERRLGRHANFLEELLDLIEAPAVDADQVTLEGMRQLLDYPEFRNVERVREVWSLLTEDTVIHGLLMGAESDGGMAVRIGAELPVPALQDLAVVSVSYRVGAKVVGRVAVVGPRRMEYGRVMAVLEQVSEELTHALNWA
jgi:heat-inducible transcriptional repressor